MIKNDKEVINVEEVEKEIFNEQQGSKRNLKLGVLEIYETHGKKLNLGEITWWQKGLRKYLEEKCNR